MALVNRVSPFEAELRSMPKNTRFGQYLRWNSSIQDYDASNFDTLLTDNKITEDDIKKVLHELRKSRYYAAESIPLACWMIPITIIFLLVIISLLNNISSTVLSRIGVLICLALLFILPVLLMVIAKRSASRRDNERVEKLKKLLKTVQAAILPEKNVDLRISSLGSYLIIDTSKVSLASQRQVMGHTPSMKFIPRAYGVDTASIQPDDLRISHPGNEELASLRYN